MFLEEDAFELILMAEEGVRVLQAKRRM